MNLSVNAVNDVVNAPDFASDADSLLVAYVRKASTPRAALRL